MTDVGDVADVIDEQLAGDDSEEDEVDEVTRLRHLLARSRQEHSEQVDKLREQRQRIEQLERDADEVAEAHDVEMDVLRVELSAAKEESQHDADLQALRMRGLETDAAALGDMEREMGRLRERVAGLLGELEEQGRHHAEETHRLTKESFSLRIKLEQTFRNTLQEIDGKYKEQAFSQLTRDSKNALVENSKLEEELAIQSIGIESLLARYKRQSQVLQRSQQDTSLHKHEESLRLEQLRKLKKERMSSEARVSHLQRNVERLGELRREFETSQAQLRAATAALEEETAGRAKEVARAAKWKQRAFALSKQMLELSSVPPLRDESGGGGGGGGRETGNGSGARHAHSRSSARRQNDPETPAAGGNSMMWSASANMDWKGGAGVGARISGLDPPHMQRVRGAGPGRTTLLKPKMLQSLPTLRGPERGSRGTEMVRDGSAPMFKHHITGR
jgi:hypothetical protein